MVSLEPKRKATENKQKRSEDLEIIRSYINYLKTFHQINGYIIAYWKLADRLPHISVSD